MKKQGRPKSCEKKKENVIGFALKLFFDKRAIPV